MSMIELKHNHQKKMLRVKSQLQVLYSFSFIAFYNSSFVWKASSQGFSIVANALFIINLIQTP